MSFSKSQNEAIQHMDGPMLVLAGPGSGKTTVITHRVKNLIEKGVNPSEILVITFTKAAAMEMKNRFLLLAGAKEVKEAATKVSFGTFHAIFFTILKRSCRRNLFRKLFHFLYRHVAAQRFRKIFTFI